MLYLNKLETLVRGAYALAFFLGRMVCAVTILAVFPVSAAHAQTVLVVGNDRGGYLHDRLIELENLNRNGVRIEIRGRVCFSTCTMFLGIPGTCVLPGTVFGFHGPSRGGQRLAKRDFDYFSQIMAGYYPDPLKTWFMETGRNRLNGVYRVKGAALIQIGVPECQDA
ncbi:hypothetical protein [Ruegeria sp.]|uniref:hypothetical protein n=1 Tax=Ruegeria sp. TaxID=1879320 RepID=UPI003B5A98A5